MELHRTYGGCHADITDVSWAPDGSCVLVAASDITARIFTLHPVPGALNVKEIALLCLAVLLPDQSMLQGLPIDSVGVCQHCVRGGQQLHAHGQPR